MSHPIQGTARCPGSAPAGRPVTPGPIHRWNQLRSPPNDEARASGARWKGGGQFGLVDLDAGGVVKRSLGTDRAGVTLLQKVSARSSCCGPCGACDREMMWACPEPERC